ncbi:iron ABC transporter permease [Kineosporia sp. J2-2]|uniref:Iron ABC transporter permease n=1 Tax=Kineosporia corallincola TaxID=2835133 RepID=A0ABS5TGR4_9ACTN|nr:iron ABC transporter permease [Kineosporia corallincola]MBT0769574.1 iron ABC transporter permease [Kineosporia corallincola]
MLAAGAVLLCVCCAASLVLGSRPVAPHAVWTALTTPDDSWATAVVRGQRMPRTVLAVLVGAALGVAGALMQSLTRNPLAEPGILGVNAGAGLAVVLAVAVAGVTGVRSYVWFALGGAGLAVLGVFLLGAGGRGSRGGWGVRGGHGGPVQIALSGVAVSAAASSLIQTVILSDQRAFDEFRYWSAGSIEGRRWPVLFAVLPFAALGLVLAASVTRALNVLALGEESARAMGVPVRLVQGSAMAAVALLSGAATAAAGPVAFVGLGAPFLVRRLVGPDQRWVVAASVVLAPSLVLLSDIAGRLVVPGSEVPVGIMTALIGGPLFMAIARGRRLEAV